MERELNESRFRRFDHETALGALRDAEAVRDASQAMLALLADRLSGVADGTRAITRRELRRLVELIDLPPLSSEHPVAWIGNTLQPADACLLVVDLSDSNCVEQVAEVHAMLLEQTPRSR